MSEQEVLLATALCGPADGMPIPPRLKSAEAVWPRATPGYAVVAPMGGVICAEIGFQVSQDGDHALGARFHGDRFVKRSSSTLAPGILVSGSSEKHLSSVVDSAHLGRCSVEAWQNSRQEALTLKTLSAKRRGKCPKGPPPRSLKRSTCRATGPKPSNSVGGKTRWPLDRKPRHERSRIHRAISAFADTATDIQESFQPLHWLAETPHPGSVLKCCWRSVGGDSVQENPRSLRARLRAGEFVLGTFLEIPSPALVEILGLTGFDFVVIDREHGPIDLAATEHLIRAAECSGINAIVRVAENHPVLLHQPLDMGAVGVQVPQVGSLEAAQAVVRGAMFAPLGERGLQPFVRGAGYLNTGTASFMKAANEDAVLVIHIEGEAGAADLARILSVERIDVIFIGPYDLSQSLGVPGQVDHPVVEQRIAEIVAASRAAGKCVGIFCSSTESAERWRTMGVTYAAVSMDAMIFRDACRQIVETVK